MSIDWGKILNSVVGSVILAALAWLWLVFTKRGQAAWTNLGKFEGLRSVAVVAVVALVLALGALIAIVVGSRKDPEEVKLETFRGAIVYAIKHPEPDQNFEASGACPDGSVLINAFCQVGGDGDPRPAAGGNLQNLGIATDGKFHCVWNGVNDTKAFRAWIQPVCARVVKK
jgi:hypothetical protein